MTTSIKTVDELSANAKLRCRQIAEVIHECSGESLEDCIDNVVEVTEQCLEYASHGYYAEAEELWTSELGLSADELVNMLAL